MSLIEQEALLEVLDKYVNPMPEDSGNGFLSGIATAISCIEDAPTIDAASVRHGRWEQGDMYDCGDVCSECDYDSAYTPCDMRYCPNCGAQMDGGDGYEAG